jgi:pimeloyl-ACP methyl ester carboxylesterase
MNDQARQRYEKSEATLWTHYGGDPNSYFLHLEKPRMRLRVQEIGEGPPLLFLHGTPNAGTTWAPLALKLADYRCLLIDLPGCGLSDPFDYQMADLQGMVVAMMEAAVWALEIEKVSIVASSSGSTFAYWYALAHPQAVERIVHLGAPGQVEGAPVDLLTRLMTVPVLNRLLVRVMPTSIGGVKNIYSQIGHGPAIEDGRIPAAYLDWTSHLLADTDTMQHTLKMGELVLNWRGYRPQFLLGAQALSRLSQPMQYIWSEADPFGGADLARQTAAASPNSELHLLPGEGHLPWFDAQDEVLHLMRDFLRPVRRGQERENQLLTSSPGPPFPGQQ